METNLLPDKLYSDVTVRGNPPSAGQISVGASAHLCRIPTAGNSVKLIDRVNGSATRLPRQCDLSVETHLLPDKLYFDVTCPWEPAFCRTSCIFESLVRGNPPPAGQISVGASAHLCRIPTAGKSEKLIDRVNGSATRLPRQCDLSVETRLLPDKVVFDTLVRGNPPPAGQSCI